MDVDYFDLDGGNLVYGWGSDVGPGIAGYLGVNYGNYGTLNSSISGTVIIGDLIGIGIFNIGNGMVTSSVGGPAMEPAAVGASDVEGSGDGNYVNADIGYLGVNWGYNGYFDAGGGDMGPTPVAAGDPVYSTGINNNVFDSYWMGVAGINYGGEAFFGPVLTQPNGIPIGGGYMSIGAADNEINSYGTMAAGQGDVNASWYYPWFDFSTGLAAANIGDGFVNASFDRNDVYGADLGIFFKNFNYSSMMVPYEVDTSFVPWGIGMNASASGNTISSPQFGAILAETYTDRTDPFFFPIDLGAQDDPFMPDFTLAVDDNTITDVWGELDVKATVVNPHTHGIAFTSMSVNDMQQQLFDMGSSYNLDTNVGMADVTITGNDILSTDTPEFGIAVEARDRSIVNGLLVHDNTVEGASNAGIGLYTYNRAMMNNAVVTDNTVSSALKGMMFRTGNQSQMNDLRIGDLGGGGNTVSNFQTGMQFTTLKTSEMQRLAVLENTLSSGGEGLAFDSFGDSLLGVGSSNATWIEGNDISDVGWGIDFRVTGNDRNLSGIDDGDAHFVTIFDNDLYDIRGSGGGGVDSAAIHVGASADDSVAVVPTVLTNRISDSDFGVVLDSAGKAYVGFRNSPAASHNEGGPALISGNNIATDFDAIRFESEGKARLGAMVVGNALDAGGSELLAHQASDATRWIKLDILGNVHVGAGSYDMVFDGECDPGAACDGIEIVDHVDGAAGPGGAVLEDRVSDINPSPALGPVVDSPNFDPVSADTF